MKVRQDTMRCNFLDCKRCGGKILDGDKQTKWCYCPLGNQETWKDIKEKYARTDTTKPFDVWIEANYNVPTEKANG